MKAISSSSVEDRTEYLARQDLEWPLSEAAANMLRVVRGAGRPYQIASHMTRVLNSFTAYRDAVGHYPASYKIAELLNFSQTRSIEAWRATFPETVSEEDIKRWLRDGTFRREAAIDDVIRACLQICASRLVGQKTQESSAENALFHALRKLEAAQEIWRKS